MAELCDAPRRRNHDVHEFDGYYNITTRSVVQLSSFGDSEFCTSAAWVFVDFLIGG